MATLQKLEEYKVDAYRQLGFTLNQAAALSKIPGLHVADVREKYLSKGCTIEQAWRILKP